MKQGSGKIGDMKTNLNRKVKNVAHQSSRAAEWKSSQDIPP